MKSRVFSFLTTVFSLFLLFGCSFQTAGTGHEGEAKIVGTLLGADNQPVENCTLTIARSQYIPEKGDLRAETLLKPQKSIVGVNGSFSFDIYEEDEYTISGIKGDELILLTDIEVTKGDVQLGNVQLEKGVSVEINPWWESDLDSNYIAIKGTDWIYNVSNSDGATFIWPEDSLTICHYNDENDLDSVTVKVEEGTVIGDTVTWKTPAVKIEDTLLVMKPVSVNVTNFTYGEVYRVDWGNGSIDTVFENSFDHLYSVADSFTLSVLKVGEIDTLILDSLWNVDTLPWEDTLYNNDSVDQRITYHSDFYSRLSRLSSLHDSLWQLSDGIDFYDRIMWIQKGEIDTTAAWYKKNVTVRKLLIKP